MRQASSHIMYSITVQGKHTVATVTKYQAGTAVAIQFTHTEQLFKRSTFNTYFLWCEVLQLYTNNTWSYTQHQAHLCDWLKILPPSTILFLSPATLTLTLRWQNKMADGGSLRVSGAVCSFNHQQDTIMCVTVSSGGKQLQPSCALVALNGDHSHQCWYQTAKFTQDYNPATPRSKVFLLLISYWKISKFQLRSCYGWAVFNWFLILKYLSSLEDIAE